MRQKANQKAQQGALRGKQDDQTLSKQQAQLEEQQKKIGDEEERQRKEDGELTRQKEGQEILLKQRLEAKQQAEYQELREELVKAEEKIASIANVVDGEANLDLASSKLPETLDGEDNEGQIEKVKVLVEEAKAKINKLESVLT
ncbi:unnamed protein product [Cylindrotheca closterium]|uniref:Uncharacterized protein n=1 Tax=Cylindrotheca closterium TaxID=2856 RepID=A0AAD2CR11_9STRA|nr:unnamed protein product [Cylindrotheca closterium]